MTEREFLKNEVLACLGEKIDSFGYSLSKATCEFIKETDFGWNKYQIVFLTRNNGWEIKPSLLVRFDVVENIFHQVSGFEKNHQKGTPTIGISIEDLDNPAIAQARFELTNKNQISDVVSALVELFENVAVPFFEKHNKLSIIDNQLNSNVKDTSLTGGIFKGTKALIIAKLVKRQDFDELENIYHSYYKDFADGFYLPEYLRLKELLKLNTHD